MNIVKLFHVLAVFVWIGNLLALTRLLAYCAKEEPVTQLRLANIYRRMYHFVGLPSLCLAVALGIVLFVFNSVDWRAGWFHMKMTFTAGLIICDIICGRWIYQLNQRPVSSKSVIKYKLLHSLVALLLIGVLTSIYVVRNKEEEIRKRILFLNEKIA